MKTKTTTLASLLAITLTAAGQTPASGIKADFNGDGFADLAIGSPLEDFESGRTRITESGSVTIIYGSAGGLATSLGTVWTQNTLGIVDTCEAGDKFGAALAAGDFNRDGFTDLAVGVPGEKNASGVITGAVHMFYGSASGLRAAGNTILFGSQYALRFGSPSGDQTMSLMAADFTGDGFADLAVECELGQRPRSVPGVLIFGGSSTGLRAKALQSVSIPIEAVEFNRLNNMFDLMFEAGDFNLDGRADLVVGAPFGKAGTITSAGHVRIFPGAAGGVSLTATQLLVQGTSREAPEAGDRFGASLAVGDFNGDGNPDLAVGVPFEDIAWISSFGVNSNHTSDGGCVQVFFGNGKNVTTLGSQGLLEQTTFEIDGRANRYPWESSTNSLSGKALASGDFNQDGFTDLAVGAPGHTSHWNDSLGRVDGGLVTIFFGSAQGMDELDNQPWIDSEADSNSVPAAGDRFGESLMVANFGRNYTSLGSRIAGNIKVDDLVIGIPGKRVDGIANAGAVRVLYGFPNHGLGISSRLYSASPLASQPGPSQLLRQGTGGVPDAPENADGFGTTLR